MVQVLRLSETPEEVELRFQVTDTGVGIDPEAQEKLFQSFSQAIAQRPVDMGEQDSA